MSVTALLFGECGCCETCEDITVKWMTHNALKRMPGWVEWPASGAVPVGSHIFRPADSQPIGPSLVSYLTRTDTLYLDDVAYCTRVITVDPLSCLPSGSSGSGTDPGPAAGAGSARAQLAGGFNDWWGSNINHDLYNSVSGTHAAFGGKNFDDNHKWDFISDLSDPYTFDELIDVVDDMLDQSLVRDLALNDHTYNSCDLSYYPSYFPGYLYETRDAAPLTPCHVIRLAEVINLGLQSGPSWLVDSGADFDAAMAVYFPTIDGSVIFTEPTKNLLDAHTSISAGTLEKQYLELDDVSWPSRIYTGNDGSFVCENWTAPDADATADYEITTANGHALIKVIFIDASVSSWFARVNLFTYCPPTFPFAAASVTVAHPAATSFTFGGSGSITGNSPFTYQWAIDSASGSRRMGSDGYYANLTNSGVYSGTTTNTLSISNTTGLNGRFFKCIVTADDGGMIASEYIFLTVT